jgi:hypothetical protein
MDKIISKVEKILEDATVNTVSQAQMFASMTNALQTLISTKAARDEHNIKMIELSVRLKAAKEQVGRQPTQSPTSAVNV